MPSLRSSASFNLRAIATDVDGTLLDSRMRILDSTVSSIQRAKRKGIIVFPATARSLADMSEILRQHDALECVSLYPGVYLNGCLAYGPGGESDIIWESCLSEEIVKKVIEWVDRVNEHAMSQLNWEHDSFIINSKMEHYGVNKAVINKKLKPMFIAVGACCREEFVYEEENQITDGLRQLSFGNCK